MRVEVVERGLAHSVALVCDDGECMSMVIDRLAGEREVKGIVLRMLSGLRIPVAVELTRVDPGPLYTPSLELRGVATVLGAPVAIAARILDVDAEAWIPLSVCEEYSCAVLRNPFVDCWIELPRVREPSDDLAKAIERISKNLLSAWVRGVDLVEVSAGRRVAYRVRRFKRGVRRVTGLATYRDRLSLPPEYVVVRVTIAAPEPVLVSSIGA